MSHKLGVCVPYRNREMHLHEFIPKVGKYLKEQGIDFQMYFAHQTDDKLFNRGATKNIAAKHALEEGCDYIVWHDIDMIPQPGADYSYPGQYPVHIATNISQMDYELKYHEYFGGAVLFTKEQVEATNGYSNNYWDWGMEDDDLFWRCHLEGLTNDTYLDTELDTQRYIHFNGENSSVEIPYISDFRNLTANSHTFSVLVRAFQQPEKNSIFLIGAEEKKYVEYPILRINPPDYGISFNNSRALSFQYWNNFHYLNYMWLKRYDNQWSWVTVVVDAENQQSHFYLNGTEVDSKAGFGSSSPWKYEGKLKTYRNNSIYLGTSTTLPDESTFKYFKGDIAKVVAWNRALSPEEVISVHKKLPNQGIVLNLDFNNEHPELVYNNTEYRTENIRVPNSILPHRIPGRFRCLPHIDEGLVNGVWAKGKTTAQNEERYVLQMQQGKVDYKQDGINSVNYKFLGEQKLTPWAKILNIEL